jgi:AcrR family transcriptional regulator
MNLERKEALGGHRPGKGGRPTSEEAVLRDERILETAAALFMERGFDATSIDAVAAASEVGKPTIYARYPGKSALFIAVLRLKITRWLAPLAEQAMADFDETSTDVEAVLMNIVRQMVKSATAPEAVALHGILAAQAQRFPDVARLAHEEGWLPTVRAVASTLQRFADRGIIHIEDAELTAELFLNLVVGRQQQPAALYVAGDPWDSQVMEQRARVAVKLFLNGVRSDAAKEPVLNAH